MVVQDLPRIRLWLGLAPCLLGRDRATGRLRDLADPPVEGLQGDQRRAALDLGAASVEGEPDDDELLDAVGEFLGYAGMDAAA